MQRLFVAFGLSVCLMGCGVTVTKNPDPVEINGTVTLGTAPMDKVVLNLQPTGPGLPASVPVTSGGFTTKLTPGKYTYFITEGKSKEEFEKVPKAFREGSMDRQVEISEGGPLVIVIN